MEDCESHASRIFLLVQREYPDRPLVGVGGVIIHEERVLIVQRGNPPRQGEWTVPGGMLELGETLRQGAEREALEETGLVVRATELLGVFDRIVPDEEGNIVYHYVLIDFLCQLVSGKLHAGADAADAQWFTPETMAQLPLAEDTAGVIRAALAKTIP